MLSVRVPFSPSQGRGERSRQALLLCRELPGEAPAKGEGAPTLGRREVWGQGGLVVKGSLQSQAQTPQSGGRAPVHCSLPFLSICNSSTL